MRCCSAPPMPAIYPASCDGDRPNSVIYEGAYGKRILDQPAPMTADTVVWIASMTKALTATGAMQLVEQGKLDLDAPAAKVVPEIASIEVLEGFDARTAAHCARPSVRSRCVIS